MTLLACFSKQALQGKMPNSQTTLLWNFSVKSHEPKKCKTQLMLFSRELAFHEGSNTILDKTNFSYSKVNIIHIVCGDQLFDLKQEFISKGKNKSKNNIVIIEAPFSFAITMIMKGVISVMKVSEDNNYWQEFFKR